MTTMNSSKIVGITGGIGCGKSTVTDFFAKLGPKIVDADIAARAVVSLHSPGLTAIRDQYGSEILLPSGELDRAKLREIIFNDQRQKLWLETLLHPLIRQYISDALNKACNANTAGYNILSSPLLLETDQHQMCDTIIVIDLTKETQINRAMQRDNNSKAQIEKIIDNQLSAVQRNKKASIIINNDGTVAQLNEQVNNIHRQLYARYSR